MRIPAVAPLRIKHVPGNSRSQLFVRLSNISLDFEIPTPGIPHHSDHCLLLDSTVLVNNLHLFLVHGSYPSLHSSKTAYGDLGVERLPWNPSRASEGMAFIISESHVSLPPPLYISDFLCSSYIALLGISSITANLAERLSRT
jgi:hypothetical protein